jgi:hypothetical protein
MNAAGGVLYRARAFDDQAGSCRPHRTQVFLGGPELTFHLFDITFTYEGTTSQPQRVLGLACCGEESTVGVTASLPAPLGVIYPGLGSDILARRPHGNRRCGDGADNADGCAEQCGKSLVHVEIVP